jgi:hypothetical protein
MSSSNEPGTQGPQKAKGVLWKKIAPSLVAKQNTYKHQPIDSRNDFRILRIFPGENHEDLKCQLLLSALRSPPGRHSTSKHPRLDYVALSYCWGDSEAVKPIRLYVYLSGERDGKPVQHPIPEGIFYVRENLDAALRNCRRSERNVDIWVDAICINQEDLAEKADQVTRMKEVYNDASEVCVWLGAGKDEKEKAEIKKTFDFMREILDLEKLDAIINTDSNKHVWQTNIDNLKLVVKLIKNPWFGRRWIIQELALAKKAIIRWDMETLLWSDFADATALLMTKYAGIREMLQPKRLGAKDFQLHDPRALGANTLVDATSNLFRKTDGGDVHEKLMTLEVLVSSLFVPFEASDPKDTIYAVLSLSKDTDMQRTSRRTLSFERQPKWYIKLFALCAFCVHWLWRRLLEDESDEDCVVIDNRIAVDYDKPWIDICAGFVEYCIEKSKSLDILCRHWAPGPKARTMKERFDLEKKKRSKLAGAENQGSGSDVEAEDDMSEEEKMPSWILPIDGHAYGGPKGVHNGRINADSLVGGFERQNKQYYNASGGLLPWIKFGKTRDSSKATDHLGASGTKANTATPASFESSKNGSDPVEKTSKPRWKMFDGTLEVRGCVLGVIEKLSNEALEGIIPRNGLELGGLPFSSHPETKEDLPDKPWRTLVADRGPEGTIAPTWYRRACLGCLKYRGAGGDLNTDQFDIYSDTTPEAMKAFISRVRSVVWKRKFFLTRGKSETRYRAKKEPLFGLAPGSAEINDRICILFGCSVPVVLRKLSAEDKYKFVGECYVHGKMDGEAIPPTLKPKWPYSEADTFTIV